MRRVLIVMQQDDCLLYALRKALEGEYEVIAADAAEGGYLLKQQPDVLVVDLFLHGTDGLAFLRQKQKALPPAVVALTVYAGTDVLEALAELGVSRVIRKPCTVSEVHRRIGEVCPPLPYA